MSFMRGKLFAALALSAAASGAQSAVLASDPIYSGNGSLAYCFLANVGPASVAVTSLSIYVTNTNGVFVQESSVKCGTLASQGTCLDQVLTGAPGDNFRHYCIASASSTTNLRGSFQTIDANDNVLITETLH